MPPAIFDGHGGHLAADYMSQNLYKVLCASITDELHNTEGQVQSEFLVSLSLQLEQLSDKVLHVFLSIRPPQCLQLGDDLGCNSPDHAWLADLRTTTPMLPLPISAEQSVISIKHSAWCNACMPRTNMAS